MIMSPRAMWEARSLMVLAVISPCPSMVDDPDAEVQNVVYQVRAVPLPALPTVGAPTGATAV